ncbi:hypothetical protein BHE74_00016532 [Ensete ventricosum]|nr:hypothetical protein GW17_00006114 [Ensete ventricosum]RWW75447.1 hypothetical protein BHE74_00016532 [Ensete ventricosum]
MYRGVHNMPPLVGRNPYSVPRVNPPQRSNSIEFPLGFYHLVSKQCSYCHLYRLHPSKQFPQLLLDVASTVVPKP